MLPEIFLEQKRNCLHGIHFLLQIIYLRQKRLSAFLIWWHSTSSRNTVSSTIKWLHCLMFEKKKSMRQAVLNARVVFSRLHQGTTLRSYDLCKFWHWRKRHWFFFPTVWVRDLEKEFNERFSHSKIQLYVTKISKFIKNCWWLQRLSGSCAGLRRCKCPITARHGEEERYLILRGSVNVERS